MLTGSGAATACWAGEGHAGQLGLSQRRGWSASVLQAVKMEPLTAPLLLVLCLGLDLAAARNPVARLLVLCGAANLAAHFDASSLSTAACCLPIAAAAVLALSLLLVTCTCTPCRCELGRVWCGGGSMGAELAIMAAPLAAACSSV